MKLYVRGFALCAVMLLLASGCSASGGGETSTDPKTPDAATSASGSSGSASMSTANDEDVLSQEVVGLISSFTPEQISVEQTDTKLSVSAFDPDVTAAVSSVQGSAGAAPAEWEAYQEAWAADAQVLAQNYPDGYAILSIEADEEGSVIYATYINGKQTYSMFGENTGSQNNPSTISLEEFEAIQTGMSYQEVFDLVGSRGELLSEVDMGLGDEYYTAIYAWEGEGTLGANANVTFQGGQVTAKAQSGLE